MKWFKNADNKRKAAVTDDSQVKRYIELYNKSQTEELSDKEYDDYEYLEKTVRSDIQFDVLQKIKPLIQYRIDSIANDLQDSMPNNDNEQIIKDVTDIVMGEVLTGKPLKDILDTVLNSNKVDDEIKQWVISFTNYIGR